ncbi:MAG TPA: gas vesicle protein [Vicinamibacterales bacterium]|nr:gas vesicle protein [Vicinamibacterales bacterium]
MPELPAAYTRSSNLVDLLDRVLDKGLVVAGDVRISLAEVELLTVRIRLLVCSIDKAQQIGLDWWRTDRRFAAGAERALETRLAALERKIDALAARGRAGRPARRRGR